MSMTRKDYRVVAEGLRLTRPNQATDPGAFHMWQTARNQVAVELKLNYRNFNIDKFMEWTEKAGPRVPEVVVPF